MEKSYQVRESLIQCADALFQRWGIRKTSLEDIAREAGKAKSSIYYYFPNKEAVIEAVVMAQANRIVGDIHKEIEGKNTAKEKLLAYVTTCFRETRRAASLFEVARGEIRTNPALIHEIMRRFRALQMEEVEGILRYGTRRKEFQSIGGHDVASVAQAIVTIIRSLILDLFLETEDTKSMDLIIEILSKGLQVVPSPRAR